MSDASQSRLEVDTVELRRAATLLRQVEGTISEIESVAEQIARTTGHDGLAAVVVRFGEQWGIARERLRDRLRSTVDRLEAMADTFEELDAAMAAPAEFAPRPALQPITPVVREAVGGR